MLHVACFTFNAFQEQTYVVYDETKNCAIIDPGCSQVHEKKLLSDFIQAHGLQVKHLINTHCHLDHILGNQYIKDTYATALAIHPQELTNLQLAATYAPQYNIIGYQATEPDYFLMPGNVIQLGNSHLEIFYVPGHSPGHIALYSQQDQICLVGDVLFKGSIGRTDLPGGNYATLLESIHQKLFTLDDQVTVYPGHGPATSIGIEKRTNRFCKITPAIPD